MKVGGLLTQDTPGLLDIRADGSASYPGLEDGGHLGGSYACRSGVVRMREDGVGKTRRSRQHSIHGARGVYWKSTYQPLRLRTSETMRE